jgi:hypothetical protein
MRVADFLRADAIAREHFFRLAVPHVWPRILRTVQEEMEKRGGGS